MPEANTVTITNLTDPHVYMRLTERETTPKDVLIELFEEELLQYPDLLADLVIARLGVRGFEIKPIDPKRRT